MNNELKSAKRFKPTGYRVSCPYCGRTQPVTDNERVAKCITCSIKFNIIT